MSPATPQASGVSDGSHQPVSTPSGTTVARGRLDVIDWLRGVAIGEMMAAHFADNLPLMLSKIVGYTETAMAMFVLLSGFMVGYHNLPKFKADAGRETRRLLGRAARLLVVQYVIVLTVTLPLHLAGYPQVGANDAAWLFLVKSLTFQNQIGIVHILPTFIPLFLISPLVLAALTTGRGALVLMVSAVLFAMGNRWPYALDLGDKTVFPFIVIQVYFVVGCFWGRHAKATARVAPRHLRLWLATSVVALGVVMVLLHGKIVPGRLVSTHPLNILGLLYHAPLILTVFLASFALWSFIDGSPLYDVVSLYGRHPMLAFVLHLYCAKTIAVIAYVLPLGKLAYSALAASSVLMMYVVLIRYERADRQRPALWVRGLDALFR